MTDSNYDSDPGEVQANYRRIVSDNLALSKDVLQSAEAWLKNKPSHSRKGAPVKACNEVNSSMPPPPPGLARLVRRLKAERDFLEQVLSSKEAISDSHAMSSNLAHLHALFLTAQHVRDCSAVLRRVNFRRDAASFQQPELFIPLSEDEDEDEQDGDGEVADGKIVVSHGNAKGDALPPATMGEATRQEGTLQDRSDHSGAPLTTESNLSSAIDPAGASGGAKQLSEDAMDQLLRERLQRDFGVDPDGDSDSGSDFSFSNGEDIAGDEEDEAEEIIEDSLIVDVVADFEHVWVKVVARNPLSLHRTCQGNTSLGSRSILAQAQDMLLAASQSEKDFAAPKVVIVFVKGITKPVVDMLESIGILVCGKICPSRRPLFSLRQAVGAALPPVSGDGITSDPPSNGDSNGDSMSVASQAAAIDSAVAAMMADLPSKLGLNSKRRSDNKPVNLDVSSMLVLCSELTHGHANYIFKSAVLNEQAGRERLHPALPALEAFLEGKDLVCCQTAKSEFTDIVSTVAGPIEKRRAEELMERVTVIEDSPSERVSHLKSSGKIRDRAKTIFGTGESLQLTTTTANMAFVRAAAGQGINFSIFQHESRALTEAKQQFATPLEPDDKDA